MNYLIVPMGQGRMTRSPPRPDGQIIISISEKRIIHRNHIALQRDDLDYNVASLTRMSQKLSVEILSKSDEVKCDIV